MTIKAKKLVAKKKTSPRSTGNGKAKKTASQTYITTPLKVDPPQSYVPQPGMIPVQIDFTPQYQTTGSACCDLIANCPPDVNGQRRAVVPPRTTVMIDCGFSMAVPMGFKACIAARSGHAKAGLMIPNAPGQVDSDFRGRVNVLLTNIGRQIMVVEHGERFAQMWLEPVLRFGWAPVKDLPPTQRGEGGFGSTGRGVHNS